MGGKAFSCALDPTAALRNAAKICRRLGPDTVDVEQVLEPGPEHFAQRRKRRKKLVRRGIGVFARNGIIKQDLQQFVILQILRVLQPLQHALSVPFVHKLPSFYFIVTYFYDFCTKFGILFAFFSAKNA